MLSKNNCIELSEEDLEKINGGETYELSQSEIDSGEFFVSMAEYIKYNGKTYECTNQFAAKTTKVAAYTYMVYKEIGGTGTLLIPSANFC